MWYLIRKYEEQFCAKKSDNLEKVDKFLETYSLPRLSQEEIDKLITRIEIASIIIKTKTENSLLTELQDWMASLRKLLSLIYGI